MRGRQALLLRLQRAAAAAAPTTPAPAATPVTTTAVAIAPSAAPGAALSGSSNSTSSSSATPPALLLRLLHLRADGPLAREAAGPTGRRNEDDDDDASGRTASAEPTPAAAATRAAAAAAAASAWPAPHASRTGSSHQHHQNHRHHRAYSSAAASAAAVAAVPLPDDRGDGDQQQQHDDASPLVAAARRDPFALVADEVAAVGERMRRTVATEVPALADAALYFLRPGVTGKRLRPTLLLLMAGALDDDKDGGGGGGGGGEAAAAAAAAGGGAADEDPLSVDLRAPHEPCLPHETRRRQQRVAEVAELIHVASLLHDDVLDEASTRRGVPALHAAGALAAGLGGAAAGGSGGGSSSGNGGLGRADKLAILAGDFLLARASVTLAALGDARVVALLSRVLEHLVAGEVMQMAARGGDLLSARHYMRKTYAKTASLMANSCRAVALVGGAEGGGDLAREAARGGDGLLFEGEEEGGGGGGGGGGAAAAPDYWGEVGDGYAAAAGGATAGAGGGAGAGAAGAAGAARAGAGAAAAAAAAGAPAAPPPLPPLRPMAAADAAWEYGRHLGLAFQVVDDLLDLTGAPGILGKPTLSDLRAGLATAPVLMAAEERPELAALVGRRFSRGGDVARAVELVGETRGVARAWALAWRHADAAAAAVRALPPARTERARAHRAALVALTRRVLERRK